ncbi:MAG: hypothetical protein HRT88_12060, partial [Lentisphaeraceae bacterium]|nr:hypothetical protein [Lentisphaeraceae bacterium]
MCDQSFNNMRKYLFVCLAVFTFNVFGVERQWPADAKELVGKYLTVKIPGFDAKAAYIKNDEDDYLCLLKENISYVNDDGSYYKIIRYVYRALNDE